MPFSRILLKLSGEALSGDGAQFDHHRLQELAGALARLAAGGVQTGVVLGAGNIFRARTADLTVLERVTADHAGMLATVMNAAVLRDYLRAAGAAAQVLAPREVAPLARAFTRDEALARLAAGEIVLLAGGTGNPFFTTDSAAALRAAEIGAEALLKATQVDGVYDRDPRRFPGARRYERLTHDEALARRLAVMDLTAVALCAEVGLPIFVFDISDPANLELAAAGRARGTWIVKEAT